MTETNGAKPFPFPSDIPARPFGAPGTGSWPEPEEPLAELARAIAINDASTATTNLWSIAAALRALTCEEMWEMCEGMGNSALAKTLIEWARSYMGEKPLNPPEPAKGVKRI